MSAQPIVGILGGMGPLAGAEFLRQLTLLCPATRDQDHVRAVLWSDPTIPDRPAALFDGGPSPAPGMIHGLRVLEQAGAGMICIACNTAHLWFEEIQAAIRTPILHIVDAAASDLARQGIGAGARVGILGTTATVKSGLYHQRLAARGYAPLSLDDAEMAATSTPSIKCVKRNDLAGSFAPLVAAVKLLRDRGAAAVVLGCTELPLAAQAGDRAAFGVPVVDTVEAHARAAIAWAKGELRVARAAE